MTPKLLLALWRDRWGKTDQGIPNRPYARGALHKWFYKLPEIVVWNSVIFRLIILSACTFIFVFSLQLEFSLNGQISFAGLIIAMIVAARRFEGALFTFFVMALGAITSAQYFHWRITKTIVHRSDSELLLSMGYCALELLFCSYFFLRLYNQAWPIEFLSAGKRWKHRATAAQNMLCFYKSFGRLAFTLLPIITLVFGYRVFKAQGEWIAPMAAPYVASIAVMYERIESKRRWGFFKALYEICLACVMSLRNAWAFVRYSLQNLPLFFKRSSSSPTERWVALKSCTNLALIALNLIAVSAGIMRFRSAGADSLSGILVLIACTNIILLLCKQAIAHESRHIEWFTAVQKRLEATIVLDSGRTFYCSTRNFPADNLQLQLPDNFAHKIDETFVLQFSHGHQPFNLTVRTDKHLSAGRLASNIISVRCCEESIADFEQLKNSVMVRDSNWPTWLADQSTDKLLPDWLRKKLESTPTKVIDWLTKAFGIMKLKNLLKLVQIKQEN